MRYNSIVPGRPGRREAMLLLAAALFAVFFPRVAAGASSSKPILFYVSPAGNDAWNGRTAEANAEKTDGPLASIAGARDAVRRLRAKTGALERPVTVEIADGVYRISETILFGPEDSGTERCPILYTAARGAKPVISGGRVIEGLRRSPGGTLWSARVPEVARGKWSFNQLFVDGTRYTLARWPDDRKWCRFKSKSTSPEKASAVTTEGGMKLWRRADTPRVVVFRTWDVSRFRIASYDRRSRLLRMKLNREKHKLTHWGGDRRYFLEDSLSFCDRPGEWFLDRGKGLLYVRLLGEHRSGKAVVTAPRVDRLVRFEGTARKPVRHITFRGLAFRYSACDIPEEGFGGHQAGVKVGAAIEADFVERCVFSRCRFERLGRNALWLRKGCRNNTITRCEFSDLAGGAVYVGEDARQSVKLAHETTGNEISNNLIRDCGRVWFHCVGVWVGPASRTRIAHNHIHHVPYSGISVGWCWSPKPSMAHHNTVEYNYIHHVMQVMSDGAGIYTLGLQPGTVVRNNVIHDSTGWEGAWWGNGIYHDQGSSEILVENNLVYRIGAFGFHMGMNRKITVRNNIVAFAKYGIYADRSTEVDFERNILYCARGLMNLRVEAKDFRSDYNLLYNPEGGFPHFNPRAKQILGLVVGGGGYNFAKWKAAGRDRHSVVADPLFRDPAKGDFSLKPTSPALRLGFKPIDVSKVGIEKPGS